MEVIRNCLQWMLDHWGLVAILLPCIIQITPIIKLNPISTFFSWVGKQLTSDLKSDVENIKTDLKSDIEIIKTKQEEQQNTIDTNEKDRIRWEVLDFANSCRNGRRHTKDEFQHVITLNEKYSALLEKTGDKNGVFEAEYDYIKRLYVERQEKNDFL